MEYFAWFENTALSLWVRESPPVFPALLIAHVLGMGVIVGVNVLLAWRVSRRELQPGEIATFVPLVWLAFTASLISGALLLAAYPAKALTNPVFYLKLALIALGFALFGALRRRPRVAHWPLASAAALLLVWFAAITTGRLLAYTNTVLLASHLF